MVRWGKVWAAAAAAIVVTMVVTPLSVAHADLLGGVTELVEDPVEDVTGTGDGATTVIQSTADGGLTSPGTVLEDGIETVGTTVTNTTGTVTKTVDDTVDTVDDTLSAGTETVTDVVRQTGGTLIGDTTTDSPTTTTTPTTPLPTSSSDRTTTSEPATTTVAARAAVAVEDETERTSAAGVSRPADSGAPSSRQSFGDDLAVLSVARGLGDPSALEPMRIVPVEDSSLYTRLLGWLSGAGSAFLGLLAGPLLALEILLRALLSAGSGLVAPASLLVSYLGRLVWESRRAVGALPA
ncbi:MAG: hypothetical protein R3246_02655 [Acidimicrobiia bacterium]|nr:hypothetical protein [Acidimicrobiia bacterium]